MNEMIKIGNQEITVKEYKGKRVVTFKDIDLCHERPEGTAGRNFRENKKHFIEEEDYFSLTGDQLREYKQATKFVGSNAKELLLVTEQGYMMLAKSLTDDLAWAVQRELVNNYFNPQKAPSSPMELLELEFAAIKEVDGKVEKVNEDLQNFKQDIPLFGSEGDEITKAVRAKGTVCLGGRKSAAYNDNSIRSKVYSDIYKQLYREFGVTTYKAIKRRDHKLAMDIISDYEPPYILQEEIYTANQQVAM